MGLLINNKIIVLVLALAIGFVGYKIIFADEKTAADFCKELADQRFEELHGRVPDRNDFLDEEIIQNDWYPTFDKCLSENQ